MQAWMRGLENHACSFAYYLNEGDIGTSYEEFELEFGRARTMQDPIQNFCFSHRGASLNCRGNIGRPQKSSWHDGSAVWYGAKGVKASLFYRVEKLSLTISIWKRAIRCE